MRRFLFTVYATVILGCFFGKAQVTRNTGGLPANATPQTNPLNISQFEVSGRLITQNAFVGLTGIPTAQQTGNFGITARWNSMGSLNAGSQILNGFRTQTDGRGLTTGFSVAGGVLSNPTIQWIGNAAGASVSPGNLEFKYALNPGAPGVPAGDANIFTMAPPNATGTIPAFNYAETNAFVGQKQSGTFGSFGIGDTWSATGQITVPSPVNLITYGARHQFQGYTVNSGLLKNNTTNITSGVLDFGINQSAGLNPITSSFKFRVFTNPNDPSSVKNVWQTNIGDGNVMMGRQDISAVNATPFYLSVFDGLTSNTSSAVNNLIARAGIYATTNTKDNLGNFVNTYASVVGDISAYETSPVSQTSFRTAILGIGTVNAALGNPLNWAGYFVGDVGYTSALLQVSDKKFKTKIEDENNMLEKLMKLEPKNYFFDTENFKNMAFSNKLQHGLISQEVEKIFPELVADATGPATGEAKDGNINTNSYKGLNYIGFIPMLIKGIQELKVENDALKTRLEKLETTTTKNTFVLTDKTNLPAEIENKAFTLSQNTPNPFSDKTTISYTIPSNVNKATLAVFDLTGKMLLQYNLQAGKNTVAINGSTLPAGMYLYSLLADGQEVLSKRMVLTK